MTAIRILFIGLLLGVFTSGCDLLFDEQKAMQAAESYQSDGNHNAAIIELKKVLKHNSSNMHARLLLGRSYVEIGQAESAEKELKFAERLGAAKSETADLWGKTLLIQKKYNSIFQKVPLSLAKTPLQKAKLMLVHGYAHAELKNGQKALELFEKVKQSGLLAVEANIALSRMAIGNHDSALALTLIDEAIAADKDNATSWLQKGQIYLARHELDKAINAFEKVIEITSKTKVVIQEFQARVYLTQIALARKDQAMAREKIDQLIKIVPSHPISMYLSALVDFREGKYDHARITLEKLLARIPNDLRSRLLLGAVQYAKGSYEQANKHLSYFVENVPTHIQARKLLAAVRVKLGQHQDAYDVLKPMGSVTDDSQLLAMIGTAAMMSDNLEEAEKYYKRAQKSNPKNQILKKELANIYLSQGAIDEAINELESISGSDKQQANKMLVYAHLRKQDFAAARKLVKEMLKQNKSQAEVFTLAGIVELAAGERKIARNHFEQALKNNKKYIPAKLSLARMDFEDGNSGLAQDGFNAVLELDDKNINAMLGLSAVYGRLNNSDMALQWLVKAKDANPKALMPSLILSQYYIKTGKIEQALSLLEDIKKTARNKSLVMPLLITAQLRAGNNKQAMATAKEFLRLKPKSAMAYLHMARVQQHMGALKWAENNLTKSLSLQENFLPASVELVNLYVRQAKYDKALKVANNLKEKYPNLAVPVILQGEIYIAQRQYRKASKSLEQAKKQNPSSMLIRKLAFVYGKGGNDQKAIQTLSGWLDTNPQDIPVRLDLALYYERHKQAEKSRRQYHKILEQSPDNVAALNNIALSYLDSDKQKALTYAQQAYNLKPDNAAISDTLGWVLLQTGEQDRAVTLLADAAAKSNNPSIRYHYAVALNESGSRQKARAILRNITTESGDFPEKPQAKQLLSKVSQ